MFNQVAYKFTGIAFDKAAVPLTVVHQGLIVIGHPSAFQPQPKGFHGPTTHFEDNPVVSKSSATRLLAVDILGITQAVTVNLIKKQVVLTDLTVASRQQIQAHPQTADLAQLG
ncbi:MAG: hypothetical protein MJK10_20095 [Pseudomonadales bacterium]|nr:hypothetical protein [Pseudomonadales bacterium]NRA18166.1 hypothetical protein [Oceanospirillaceae bacterium]